MYFDHMYQGLDEHVLHSYSIISVVSQPSRICTYLLHIVIIITIFNMFHKYGKYLIRWNAFNLTPTGPHRCQTVKYFGLSISRYTDLSSCL